jgi:hypothetical protein
LLPDRVTRLAEFLPLGRLFTLGIFLSYRSSSNVLATFFTDKRYVLISIKCGLGYILGVFLTLVTLLPALRELKSGANLRQRHHWVNVILQTMKKSIPGQMLI